MTASNCSNVQPSLPIDSSIIYESSGKFQAYKCNDPKQWLSGHPAKITQCKNNEWTEILDFCDEGNWNIFWNLRQKAFDLYY